MDEEGRLLWANRAAQAFSGWDIESRLGCPVFDLVHPDDLQFAFMSLGTVRSKEVGTPIELRVGSPEGWKLVELVGANRLDDPEVGCLVLTVRDLTERRRWEVGRSDDAVFRTVVHNAASLLVLLAPDGTIKAASAAVTRALQRDQEALEGAALLDLVAPEHRSKLEDSLEVCGRFGAAPSEPVTVEVALTAADGSAVPYELSLVDLSDDPTVNGVVVSGHNITKLRLAQDALMDLARKDPLTMLPNRAAADQRLEELLDRHAALVVAFVDLDGFKALNDRYGHVVGDQVLRAVAGWLAETVRPADLVARFGGDEFLVVAEATRAEPAGLARRLASAARGRVDTGEHLLEITASVGVACSQPGDTPTEVIRRADAAMYRAKAAGRRGTE